MTLVEILISVAILATGAVLILQALARGAQALSLARSRAVAYAFASAKMADVELATAQGKDVTPEGQFRAGHESFHWHLEAVPTADEPELQLVTLTVGWRQGRDAYTTNVSTMTPLPKKEEGAK